jgi:anthranilate/para-aminobenzoate synthase component I
MRASPVITTLPELRDLSPLDVASRWPLNRRLMMLHSGREHERWARWSILAEPFTAWRFDGHSHWVGPTPLEARDLHFADDPLVDLDAVLCATQLPPASPMSALPFAGGWIGFFGYELGGVIEPRAQSAQRRDGDSRWPLIELAWCPAAMVFDHAANQWYAVGDVRGILRDLSATPIESEPSRSMYEVSSFKPAIEESSYCSMYYFWPGVIYGIPCFRIRPDDIKMLAHGMVFLHGQPVPFRKSFKDLQDISAHWAVDKNGYIRDLVLPV